MSFRRTSVRHCPRGFGADTQFLLFIQAASPAKVAFYLGKTTCSRARLRDMHYTFRFEARLNIDSVPQGLHPGRYFAQFLLAHRMPSPYITFLPPNQCKRPTLSDRFDDSSLSYYSAAQIGHTAVGNAQYSGGFRREGS